METLLGLGALWAAAAAVMTLGLARASGHEEPFRLDVDHLVRH